MRIPESLATLADYGIIEEVIRPLMSGKEAQVYLVIAGGQERVAKIYKEAQDRSFKHRAEYTEGRKVRNTRDQRAISKRSSHGRAQDEAAWRSTEVNMIYRLQNAGVRVPVPYHFLDGVLVMELITDADGNPAPRLGDLEYSRETAIAIYDKLVREVVRMLCAGVVHGDLSEFNVLMAADGPVIIDFPQSVDSAHNQNARKLLLRDVDNLHRFLARFVRDARRMPYAEEMWELYQSNGLTPDTRLTGRFRQSRERADTASVLALIEDARQDERRRREGLAGGGGRKGAMPVIPQRSEVVATRQALAAGPEVRAPRVEAKVIASVAPVAVTPPAGTKRRRKRRRSGGAKSVEGALPTPLPTAQPPAPASAPGGVAPEGAQSRADRSPRRRRRR